MLDQGRPWWPGDGGARGAGRGGGLGAGQLGVPPGAGIGEPATEDWDRGERPDPWSSLVSIPTGTTARCSRLPHPPCKAQAWHAGRHAGISSILLAGGREAASFIKVFLFSAPCHWSSTQLISGFLVPGYGLTPLTSHLILPPDIVSSWLWSSKPKLRQHWGGPVFPGPWAQASRKN